MSILEFGVADWMIESTSSAAVLVGAKSNESDTCLGQTGAAGVWNACHARTWRCVAKEAQDPAACCAWQQLIAATDTVNRNASPLAHWNVNSIGLGTVRGARFFCDVGNQRGAGHSLRVDSAMITRPVDRLLVGISE